MAAQLTPRFVGLMVTGALLAGWMGASLTQPAAPAQSGPATSTLRPIGTAPSIIQQAERLRQHMAAPPQPARGRNPFVYGPPPSRRTFSDHQAQVVEAPPMPVAPPPPPLPVFKLSGIASNVEGGVPVLTAIISDNGNMVFAKAGDKLSRGYSVVSVEETSVTLVDALGVTQTIRLP
jgi:hypothetical protein